MAEMNRSEQLAMSLTKKQIKSIILDVNGVLYESGESTPIEGSVDAYERQVVVISSFFSRIQIHTRLVKEKKVTRLSSLFVLEETKKGYQ